jgi:3',5'-cyclic AMP phosphodiesterase CpdA
VDKELAQEIKKKCENNWERKRYYHFMDKKWDLTQGMQQDEISWLKWRKHVRQLQEDLAYFTVVKMSYLPFAEQETGIHEALNLLWKEGKYDKWTELAVSFFVDAASAGTRYNPLNKRLEYTVDPPTYAGKLVGPVDGLIKTEIQEWFKEIENLIHFRELYLDPESKTSFADLSAAHIVHPIIGTTVLVKENDGFHILLAVPEKVNDVVVTKEILKEILPYYLFIHKPVNTLTPFMSDHYIPSYQKESKLFITEVKKMEPADYRFYQGTKNVIKPDEYKAEYIDSGPGITYNDRGESVEIPAEEGLYTGLDGVEIKVYNEEIKQKIRLVYEEKYDGLIERENQKGNKIWEVHLHLSNKIKPGIHLLKFKTTQDTSPHPVRVFKENKKTYNILHITDLHLAERFDYIPHYLTEGQEEYNNPNDRFRDLINQIKDKEIVADFVVLTGDVVDNANNYRPYDGLGGEYFFKPIIDADRNWRYFHSMIAEDPGINVPIYISLGNHDYRPNPVSIPHYESDLNLREEAIENFPYDTRDSGGIFGVGEISSKWLSYKCLGDVLYADERAVQYFYEHICPFSDFHIGIDNLNLILMNSGYDEKIFVDSYGLIDDFSLIKAAIFGHKPAPPSIGLSDQQLAWLDRVLQNNRTKTNVLGMHSALIYPPDDEMVVYYETAFRYEGEKDITPKIMDFIDSTILYGRETLLGYIVKGLIKVVLTGHTHKNCEIRCDPSNNDPKYYIGHYSDPPRFADPVDLAGNGLILSTISSGVVGIDFMHALDNWWDSLAQEDDIERVFSHVGYRMLSIRSTGEIQTFNDHTLYVPPILV